MSAIPVNRQSTSIRVGFFSSSLAASPSFYFSLRLWIHLGRQPLRSIFVVGQRVPNRRRKRSQPPADSLTKPYPAVASEWDPSEISRHRLSIGVRQLDAMGRQNDSSFGNPLAEPATDERRPRCCAEHGRMFEIFRRFSLAFPLSPFDPKPAPHGLKVIPRRQRRA